MDQNQTVDNDLQKAIDDITSTTDSDPVFADPVAAPSTIPEGDTGELGAPIGPFPPAPAPEPKVEMIPPAPEPIAPLQSMNNIPELDIPMPPTEPAAPTPNSLPTSPTSEPTDSPASEPIIEQPEVDTAPPSGTTAEIKKAALRDLIPILDKTDMDITDKFNVYKDAFNDLKDYTILDPAYRTAREIPDEKTRADALLSIIKSIDRM